MSARWRNWARTETSTPVLEIAPHTVDQIVLAVNRARETGHPVKAIGASHSFTGVGATDGILLHLNRLRGLVSANVERQQVTLWGGTRLWEIPEILEPLGLAMPNLGDIDRQTITGATQTGTHGTGLAFPGLAAGIVGMTLVTGTGEILELGEDEAPMLDATALGLGALGIIVSVTLQCVPRFLLRAVEAPDTLEHVLNTFEERSQVHDHFEFYWFPHTENVRTKANTRLPFDAGRQPLSPVSRWLDEEFVNNTLLGTVLSAEHAVPAAIPTVNRLIDTISSQREYTDRSDRVFVTSRRVRFKETEFAIPLEQVPQAVRDIATMIERKRLHISFPIEVRSAAADTRLLSTAHGRETGYIAVHRFWREDERAYFREIQAIMLSHGGRPHWGKMHTLTSDFFAREYPRFNEFLAIRDRFDPDRVFRNPYLERVLGE